MTTLDTPIEHASKVTKAIVPSLKRLGIKTVRDLLCHLPFRYDDFSTIKKIADVQKDEVVTVRGIVASISRFHTRQSHQTVIQMSFSDETGTLKAIWFNQPFLYRNFVIGDTVNISGKAELRKGGLIFQNPAYEKISSRKQSDFSPLHTGKLVPIYPETRGITSRWLRFLISSYLCLRDQMTDFIPVEIRKDCKLMELKGAIFSAHAPASVQEAATAAARFQFEHVFFMQLHALMERGRLRQKHAPVIAADVSLIKEFIALLPFSLTDAQRRSLWEIMNDIKQPIPMNRILQGDVGSGKTVVAAAAALLCAKQNKNVAFLAPTEILARQHLHTIEKLVSPFDVPVGFYTGSEKRIPPRTRVFVGTHALFTHNIRIKNLCLVIVDEQHRFGVAQRAALLRNHQSQDECPHFLSMSATPIPRTLALTLYGDLDISVLDEMPKNRKPVITRIIHSAGRQSAYDFIRSEVKKGGQVFVVCPRIDSENDALAAPASRKIQQRLIAAEIKTVTDEYKKLSEDIFPDLHIGMLHGKLKPKEKADIIRDFQEKNIDILVATSVIEVGVDIPNATVMMIEGAERFGLAQLHQFRGRVGRGPQQSYCFLFASEEGMAVHRLDALTKTVSGFELAEIDLRLRGPGDLLGTTQWGDAQTLISALANPSLILMARRAAADIIKKSPDLTTYPALKQKIDEMQRLIHAE